MYKGLGISELLLNVMGQIETTGAVTELADHPFKVIKKITLTFNGSKTPFIIKGADLRWVHRLYNGVDPDVLIGTTGAEAVTYTIAGTTAAQLIRFYLKLPVFIPVNLFTRGTLEIEWADPTIFSAANLVIDNFYVYPSLVWDDQIPFMLNYAEEEQTWTGQKDFKPPSAETLRHILMRVTD